MPRPERFAAETLVRSALPVFWRNGYSATSMAELTGSGRGNRQAIYGAFRDKRALFLACIDEYRAVIVDPAFAPIERSGAGLAEIAAYFEQQIAAAEREGLPGPGCLLANALVELAHHDPEIAGIVRAHLRRLTVGFANALCGLFGRGGAPEAATRAALLTITAQGLWSVSRVATDAEALRAPVRIALKLVEEALTCTDRIRCHVDSGRRWAPTSSG